MMLLQTDECKWTAKKRRRGGGKKRVCNTLMWAESWTDDDRWRHRVERER